MEHKRQGDLMDSKVRYLELIQGVINRMAGNSFALKGWSVTLVAGIFALASKDTDKLYFLVAYIPIVVFWGLDSYYLLQERLYRALYDKVRLLTDADVDYSMKVSPKEFKSETHTFLSCFTSKTEFWFYFPLAMVSTGIVIVTLIC